MVRAIGREERIALVIDEARRGIGRAMAWVLVGRHFFAHWPQCAGAPDSSR